MPTRKIRLQSFPALDVFAQRFSSSPKIQTTAMPSRKKPVNRIPFGITAKANPKAVNPPIIQ